MSGTDKWIPEIFENAYAGVNSAVTPELIQLDQNAWGINVTNRGTKPGTRPPFVLRADLPSGLVQGSGFFGVQGGIGVVSITGRIYRIRIAGTDFTFEQIPLDFLNSPIVKQVWMQQTVETLVIQDGQSSPILYNGGTARRAGPTEVPLGRMMAYGNGRLWVAINANELVAGDIRTRTPGSELFFTETNYLSGGGSIYIPEGITALAFIPVTGTSDYGTLMVFGPAKARSVRADITQRDLWATYPGFVTNILDDTGCAGDWSVVEVNQDLYWRDSTGGIRSIRSSLADESGPGNSPISREVSRLTDYDSRQLLPFCTGILFANRLLMTTSPSLNPRGGVNWNGLISLDFAPVSTMRGKTDPAYDGQWDGLNIVSLFSGQFNGQSRAFAISTNDDLTNSLWEIMPDDSGTVADESEDSFGAPLLSPIQGAVELGRRSFGDPKKRKRLRRCDVYLADIEGSIDLAVYWRTDNNQKWLQWDSGIEACTMETDPPTTAPHVWKNLLPGQRPQIKTFTIPEGIDAVTKYGANIGFEFQIRLVWTGKLKIYKTVLWADFVAEPAYALRDLVTGDCVDNDVSAGDQQLVYKIPVHPTETIFAAKDTLTAILHAPVPGVACSWTVVAGPPGVNLGLVIISYPNECDTPVTVPAYGRYVFQTDDGAGGDILLAVIFELDFEYGVTCRTRFGVGTLCGYAELANPSVPPRRYLQKTISGMLKRCEDSCAPAPTCGVGKPIAYALSMTGQCMGYPGVTATAFWVGWNPGTNQHKYQVQSLSGGCACVNPVCHPEATFDYPGFGAWTPYAAGGASFLANPCDGIYLSVRYCDPIAGCTFLPTGPSVQGWVPPFGFTGYPVILDTYDYSGVYNIETCVLTFTDNSLRKKNANTECSLANVAVDPADPTPPEVSTQPGIVAVVGKTLGVYTGSGVCGSSGSSAPDGSTYGEVTTQLSIEDTEVDAIERLFPDANAGWSKFLPPGFAGGTECPIPTCCEANYQPRVGTSQVSFSITEAQFRVVGSNVDPLRTWELTVQFLRRNYMSSDPWELFITATYTLEIQDDGTFSYIGTVPNDSGFETYAASFGVTAL